MTIGEHGKKLKHFNAICPQTKIMYGQIYDRATSSNAALFLSELIEVLPFKVRSIEVDGGSECMADFEQACHNKNSELYVIPPRTPECNGNVERVNSTAKYEFHYQYSGPLEKNLQRSSLRKFNRYYNEYKPHQGINYLTPAA